MSSFGDINSNQFTDADTISTNIGGIPTAPDEPSLDFGKTDYGVVWVGKEGNGNDVFFAYSKNGKGW